MLSSLLSALNLYAQDADLTPSSEPAPKADGTPSNSEVKTKGSEDDLLSRFHALDVGSSCHLPGSFDLEDSTTQPSSSTATSSLQSNHATQPLFGTCIPQEFNVTRDTVSEDERGGDGSKSGDAHNLDLETHIIAASLTTKETDYQHQNRLFMSSSEVYDNAAQTIPPSLAPIGQRFGRRSTPRPSTPPYASASLPNSPSSSNPPATAKPTKVENDEWKALSKLEEDVQKLNHRLHTELSQKDVNGRRALLEEVSNDLHSGMKLIHTLNSRERDRSRKTTRKPLLESQGHQIAHLLQEKRERVKRLVVNLEMVVMEIYAPLLPDGRAPLDVDSSYVYEAIIQERDIIHQVVIVLALICNVIMGLSIVQTNFLLGAATLLVRLGMSHGTSADDTGCPQLSDTQDEILTGIPHSLHEALRDFPIDSKLELYATCPSCNATHPPSAFQATDFPVFPETCRNEVVGESGTNICGAPLLQPRSDGTNQPVKPYLVGSFSDYLARCLSDPAFVKQSNLATDKAHANIRNGKVPSEIHNIFEAEFMKDFCGPDGKLFVDRGKKIRLAFALHMDFFNPNGVRKRGNHNSIGIISAANLALDPSIRYLPEFMFFGGIVPGPHEPDVDEIDHFLRPIILQFQRAWRPGFRFSHVSGVANRPRNARTCAPPIPNSDDILRGGSDSDSSDDLTDAEVEEDEGALTDAVVESAVVLSVNDLPTARKLAGLQGHRMANFICSVCDLSGSDQIFSTDYHRWKRRDWAHLRTWARAWKEAKTSKDREHIFEHHGVRWSSMWELDYWDPTRMLVVDSMHCILEGLVHYHCRHVLRLDASAKTITVDGFRHAFDWPWVSYDGGSTAENLRIPQHHIPRVAKIQEGLCLALEGERSSTLNEVWTRLENVGTKESLQFVAWTLGFFPGTLSIRDVRKEISDLYVQRARRRAKDPASVMFPSGPMKDKNHFIAVLLNWRLGQGFRSQAHIIPTSSPETLKYVQRVISQTKTPSWVNSVPKNYGESNAGTIKADEWRTLSTIYLPITLVTLWGDLDGHAPPSDDSDEGMLAQALDHTMALFQATVIACRYTMTRPRALAYREHLTHWVTNLRKLYPQTYESIPRPNIHMAGHIYDFLLLFGPVLSWWCFPFERLIGTLQKVKTNDRIGGVLESTIMRSQTRAANIRRWLRRTHCPEAIKQLKVLFDKCFVPANAVSSTKEQVEVKSSHRCYVKCNEVNFSPYTTHEGNSIIMYRPTPSSEPVAGRIERIENVLDPAGAIIRFHVRQYLPLPPSLYDPFERYKDFPAKTFSSLMKEALDDVGLTDVIGHAARFDFSHQRSVFCNLSRA